MCNNGKLQIRGTEGSAVYDLTAGQYVVIPRKGETLVQTDVSWSIPVGSYGRIDPTYDIALKQSIDVGSGVIDADYRGKLV